VNGIPDIRGAAQTRKGLKNVAGFPSEKRGTPSGKMRFRERKGGHPVDGKIAGEKKWGAKNNDGFSFSLCL